MCRTRQTQLQEAAEETFNRRAHQPAAPERRAGSIDGRTQETLP
jgi:hypothetical protein